MNLEEIFTVLKGASRSDGVKYEVMRRWFQECGIIDGRIISEPFFAVSYERLAPNREELSLVQVIQLLGILSRESKRSVSAMEERFRRVQQQIIDEIREARAGSKSGQV